MKLELDETQQLVQGSARELAARVIAPIASRIDREGAIPPEVIDALAVAGLLGVNVPSLLGGSEAGAVSYALAMIEVARACASTAVTMAVTNMVAEVIARFGSDEQKRAYVPGLCDGTLRAGAFALSEADAGSDPGAMRTSARREGSEWVLEGAKQWITSGAIAGVFVVWARTGERGAKGLSAFLVPRGTPGLVIGRHEDKMGLRGSSTTEVHLDRCRLPESALLGELGGGFRIAMMALDGGRIGIGAQAIGIAEAALARAIEHARGRRTFGRALAEHQGVQWMIADSSTELDAARLLVLRAASLKERGVAFSSQAAMAKLFASEAAGRICDRAVQIHGGYGYTREHDVERHYRDVRVTRIYEGTSEIQRIVISRAALG